MAILLVGLIIFLGVHSLSIINKPWRDSLAGRLGELPFKGIYSLVSLLGLLLIIWGYGLARQAPIVIYAPPFWIKHLVILLMLPFFVLFLATYFQGKIKAVVKHPMLVSVKLWALAHLLANGMLADLLLFGAFLAWAVVDRISVKKRLMPAAASVTGFQRNDVIALVGGLGLYVLFVLRLHGDLIGVPLIAAR